MKLKFMKNTDTIDIQNKAIGVHTINGLDNRGLCISINHNGKKEQFDIANEMASVITHALNLYFKEKGEV